MINRRIMAALLVLIAASDLKSALPPEALPQPIFEQHKFLLLPNIEELNIDYALAWTDSAEGLFVSPFDGVVLHVNVSGEMRDVFIISDIGMQRLAIWMCTEPDQYGVRQLLKIKSYYGSPEDSLVSPSGLAISAVNRKFDPFSDVIWAADRGKDRIIEMSYWPDTSGGELQCNRKIGQGYLEWPVDLALCTYGSSDPADADLYVVDWGHVSGDGELLRFDLSGNFEGSWHNIVYPGSELVLSELSRPISVACFPDSNGASASIYLTEATNNPMFRLRSTTSGIPEFADLYDLDPGGDFWEPGGIAFDDFGRVYAANPATGQIQMFGPELGYIYESFGELGEGQGQLNYPSNLLLDSYHDACEALVFETYGRKSGLQTFFVLGGLSSGKPMLGIRDRGLVNLFVKPDLTIPGKPSLYDAYPNPFNSRCLISFAIPRSSTVRIDVFNIMGQRVITLLNEVREAGEHSVIFDADENVSGIYFYRLKTDDFTQTKSIVLLK